MVKFKLDIELIPSTVWFTSLYKICKKSGNMEEWSRIKTRLFMKEGRRCKICGDTESKIQLHEFFSYDDKNHIQKVIDMHHLCNLCHKIKHIGFWLYTLQGLEELKANGLCEKDIIKHFCNVNECTIADFEKHRDYAFAIHKERSQHEWKIEFGKYQYLVDVSDIEKMRLKDEEQMKEYYRNRKAI